MKKKKYLKPQVDVAQTGPCMMINPSQVRIYKGQFQNRQELEEAGLILDEKGFLWGGINSLLPLLSITINEWYRGAPKLKQKMTINMIKKMTQYLLQRRCALSLLLMLMLLQPVMAQIQDRRMYARLDRETQTLTLYYDKNKQTSDNAIYARPLWGNYVERKAIQTVVFDESFKHARPKSCDQWFYCFEGLTKIEHLDYLNTSEVENMGSMFSKCTSLETLDLSSFNTEKVTNMLAMFEGSMSLRTIKLPKGFIGSNVTNLNATFRGCASLTELDLSGSNAEKVKDMGGMFYGCVALSNLNLSGFKTGSVTDMPYLFSSCQSLESLDLSGFNTENVTSMESMFSQCSSLRSLDLSSFNTSKVIDMHLMFFKCTNLESIDLSSFDTENLQRMAHMFSSCTKLAMLDLSSFATLNMTSMLSAFQYCKNLKAIYVTSAFTTDKVGNMSNMFNGCTKLHDLNISSFNTENVTNMYGMFYGCSSLDSLDLSHFNTRYVRNDQMNYMFNGCSSLSYLNVSNFTTDKPGMQLDGLFQGCSSLQTLDLSSFDISGAGSVNYLFDGCSALQTIYVSDLFKIKYGVKSSNMFRDCHLLKGAISFEPTKKNETYANYKSGYLTKKVGTNGNEIIGATGYPLTIDALPLDDSKAYKLYEDCDVNNASYEREVKSEWATLCLPYTIHPSSENNTCYFYTLKSVGTESVELVRVEEGVIEAGQPVVVRKKNAEQTSFCVVSGTASPDEKAKAVTKPTNRETGHRLMGTFAPIELADDCYFIAKDLFRLVSDYKPAATGVKIAAYRAYIQPDATQKGGSAQLTIGVDEGTNQVDAATLVDLLNDTEAEYYDVQGRRIPQLQRGINIVKVGSKVMKVFCPR